MPAEVIELINAQALKSNKATSESNIGIGDMCDDFINEYEPHIPEQVVIQKNRNPVAEDFVQPENQIKVTKELIRDNNNNNLPSTQVGYEDDIQKMVINSMEIVEIYEPNDNEQEIINKDNQ